MQMPKLALHDPQHRLDTLRAELREQEQLELALSKLELFKLELPELELEFAAARKALGNCAPPSVFDKIMSRSPACTRAPRIHQPSRHSPGQNITLRCLRRAPITCARNATRNTSPRRSNQQPVVILGTQYLLHRLRHVCVRARVCARMRLHINTRAVTNLCVHVYRACLRTRAQTRCRTPTRGKEQLAIRRFKSPQRALQENALEPTSLQHCQAEICTRKPGNI